MAARSADLVGDDGGRYVATVDGDGLVTSIDGPWIWGESGELVLTGELGGHRSAAAPDHVTAEALDRGEDVCFYDNVACRTCFCDGSGRMRCVPMC
jgi:hypothetical protein